MNITKYIVVFATLLLAAGCDGTGISTKGDAAEDKANKADQYGHAVYTENGSRDTTVRATMALDSRKQGAEGGWE